MLTWAAVTKAGHSLKRKQSILKKISLSLVSEPTLHFERLLRVLWQLILVGLRHKNDGKADGQGNHTENGKGKTNIEYMN